MLSGRVAMSLYTQPRFTRDYDFIVHLKNEHIDQLLRSFSEGYYLNEASVKEAIRNQTMFTIIDHKSGYKANFMILKNEPLSPIRISAQKKS